MPMASEAVPTVTHAPRRAPRPLAADSAATDTAAVDTLQPVVKTKTVKKVKYITVPAQWTYGIRPTPRNFDASRDPGILSIFVLMFLLIAMSFKYLRHLFPMLFKELFDIRSRSRVFDEHTSSQRRMMLIMIAQTIVFGGISLTEAFNEFMPGATIPDSAFVPVLTNILLIGAWYAFELIGYGLTGYAFTSPELASMWNRGFNASMALFGFPLALLTIVMVLYPPAAKICLFAVAIMFLIAKLIFIYKGFRIFYHKIPSLLYFILYLCTLEIIPIFIIFKVASLFATD
jgi:hypothetical protein